MRGKTIFFFISLVFIFYAGAGVCFAQDIQYTYDDLNRLTKAEYGDGTVIEYAYDEVGNRLSKQVTKLLDSDNDGLANDLENTLGTNPFDADTDDDGLLDGKEDVNHNGVVDTGETDPCNVDTDSDGIQDGTELGLTSDDIGPNTDPGVFQPDSDPSSTTIPWDVDTDGDGLSDGEEDSNQNGMLDSGETDPAVVNPAIILIDPPFGKVGTQVKITGFNFGDAGQTTKQVTFYNGVAGLISFWSDTEIICTVPAGIQSGYIKVTNDLGVSNRVFFSFARHVPGDYATIQAGIDAAAGGDTVVVADGTYTGAGNKDLDFNGKAITVRSQNGAANCIINCENAGRGFYFHNGEGEDSILSGITIINGSQPANNGGAILCYSSSPTITDCVFNNNTAGWGGAVNCYTASPTISNCTISGNTAVYYGGGLYGYKDASPTVINCTISNNTAAYYGGGIECNDCSLTIVNSTISGNSASAYYGGGIYCTESTLTIRRCAITGNNAKYGGAIYYYNCPSPSTHTNCVISGNTAQYGAGIYCYTASPDIINCTVSKNTASSFGGGFICYGASPTITNSILWGNSPEEIYKDETSAPVVTYCDIQGGYAGNINVNPSFVDFNAGNYHLALGSPCIDAGSNVGAPAEDRDGVLRPQDGDNNGSAVCDMGAYEYGVNSPPVSVGDSYTVDESGVINQATPGVLANDTDDENDTLSASLVADVSYGSLTLNADGSFSYVHDGSETVSDSFTYKANDGTEDGNVASVNIIISAANDAPLAVEDSYVVDEGGTINESVQGVLINDSDSEDDPLTAILVADVSHGSLTFNNDGSFIYVHNGSETTSDTFTYRVNDGINESNVATVSITVNALNDAPAAVNDEYTIDEGGSINMPAPGVLLNDTDAEEGSLTAVLASAALHGSVTLTPAGAFSYVHNGSETTNDSFTYKANDGKYDSNIAIVSITIESVNDAPVLEWTDETGYTDDGLEPEAGSGQTDFTFRIKYRDVDNDAPTIYQLYLDKNGDGDYDDSAERLDMQGDSSHYAAGVVYSYTAKLPYSSESQNCSYYFRFSDGGAFAQGNIENAVSAATAINKPDIFQTISINIDQTSWALPQIPVGSEHITDDSSKVKITNDGDGAQTYSLAITDPAVWSAAANKNGAGVDTFVLSAVFTGEEIVSVDSTYFNEDDSDDVILEIENKASSTRFAGSKSSQNGASVFPKEERNLWFEFKAPNKDTKGGEHPIAVSITAKVP